ncbi:hypothetical protein ACQPZJ_21690 [Actinoplanes sp. CA-054009]
MRALLALVAAISVIFTAVGPAKGTMAHHPTRPRPALNGSVSPGPSVADAAASAGASPHHRRPHHRKRSSAARHLRGSVVTCLKLSSAPITRLCDAARLRTVSLVTVGAHRFYSSAALRPD